MTTGSKIESQRIETIEAGRGIAALAVVLFHADSTFSSKGGADLLHGLSPFSWGERGVDFFFVLSGFIIFHAHRKDSRSLGSLGAYCAKRMIRVYPLLWLVTGFVFAANVLLDHESPSLEKTTTSFLLTPSLVWPSPSVSWTLRHEVLFYVIFAVSMLSRRLGMFALATWFATCAGQAVAILLGHEATGINAFFLSPLNLDFAFGIAAAVFAAALPRVGKDMLPAIMAVLALALVFTAYAYLGGAARRPLEYADAGQVIWNLAFGCAFGLMVFTLVRWHGRVRTPKFLVALGGASYALYLVHTPIMGLAGRFVVQPLSSTIPGAILAYSLLVGMSVLAAFAAHLMFEKPIARALRQRLSRRDMSTTIVHSSGPA